MKSILIYLALGLAASEKLDRTYLPPPNAQHSGGRPGDIEVPFEHPKQAYPIPGTATGSNGPISPEGTQLTIGINRRPGTVRGQTINKVAQEKGPSVYYQQPENLPTTTTSYAFTQTTTYPPPGRYETTANSVNSSSPRFGSTSGPGINYQPGQTYPQSGNENYNNEDTVEQNRPGYVNRPQVQQYVQDYDNGNQNPTYKNNQNGQAHYRPDNTNVFQKSSQRPDVSQTQVGQQFAQGTRQPFVPLVPGGNANHQIVTSQPGQQQLINNFGQDVSPAAPHFIGQPDGSQLQGSNLTYPEQNVPANPAYNIPQQYNTNANQPHGIESEIYPGTQFSGNHIPDSQSPGLRQGGLNIYDINTPSSTPGYENQPTTHIFSAAEGDRVTPGTLFSSTTSRYPIEFTQNGPVRYDSRSERPQAESDRNAVILNYENVLTPEGFAYSFDTSNGIHADESGTATDGVKAQGSYSYIGDDGKEYLVIYTADEKGFQPRGDHLPTSPPIPEAILRVIEQATKDKEAGVSDDGLYDDLKYGYKKYQPIYSQYKNRLPSNMRDEVDLPENRFNVANEEDRRVPSSDDDVQENNNDLFDSRKPVTGEGNGNGEITSNGHILQNIMNTEYVSDNKQNKEGNRYPSKAPNKKNQFLKLKDTETEYQEPEDTEEFSENYDESNTSADDDNTSIKSNVPSRKNRPTQVPLRSKSVVTEKSLTSSVTKPGLTKSNKNQMIRRRPGSNKQPSVKYSDSQPQEYEDHDDQTVGFDDNVENIQQFSNIQPDTPRRKINNNIHDKQGGYQYIPPQIKFEKTLSTTRRLHHGNKAIKPFVTPNVYDSEENSKEDELPRIKPYLARPGKISSPRKQYLHEYKEYDSDIEDDKPEEHQDFVSTTRAPYSSRLQNRRPMRPQYTKDNDVNKQRQDVNRPQIIIKASTSLPGGQKQNHYRTKISGNNFVSSTTPLPVSSTDGYYLEQNAESQQSTSRPSYQVEQSSRRPVNKDNQNFMPSTTYHPNFNFPSVTESNESVDIYGRPITVVTTKPQSSGAFGHRNTQSAFGPVYGKPTESGQYLESSKQGPTQRPGLTQNSEHAFPQQYLELANQEHIDHPESSSETYDGSATPGSYHQGQFSQTGSTPAYNRPVSNEYPGPDFRRPENGRPIFGNQYPSSNNQEFKGNGVPVSRPKPVDAHGRPVASISNYPGSTIQESHPELIGSTSVPPSHKIQDSQFPEYTPGEVGITSTFRPTEQFSTLAAEKVSTGSTERIIGEDFSGPKQPQRFDPNTGYHY